MKIVKKHAVTLTKYLIEYLECGYYPIDDIHDESKMFSHIMGFGLHHGLVEQAWNGKWANKHKLPRIGKVARINLTQGCSCVILDMMAESLGRDIDDTPALISLRKYLIKEFPVEEDPTDAG